jgi:hypothetical protein
VANKKVILKKRSRSTFSRGLRFASLAVAILALLAGAWAYSYYHLQEQPSEWLPSFSFFGASPPSARKFNEFQLSAVKSAAPMARQSAEMGFMNLHFDLKQATNVSHLSVCYLEAQSGELGAPGYNKVCSYTITAVFYEVTPYAETLSSFLRQNTGAYGISKNTGLNEQPCTYFSASLPTVDICPIDVTAQQLASDRGGFITADNLAYSNELPHDPSGTVHAAAFLNHNQVLERDLFDMRKVLESVKSNGNGSLIIAQVSDQYFRQPIK